MFRAFVLLILLTLSAPAFGYDFVIKEHDVSIRVLKNAAFEVTERYLIDFGTPRRGVILEIPYIYREGSIKGTAKRPNLFGGRYRILISDIKTDSAEMKVSSSGFYKEIRLGSPDVRITGLKEYIVTYKVFGAVNFFKSSSEIYWNVHGTGWNVPAENVSFEVVLPDHLDLPAENMFVYTGIYGSEETDAEYGFDGKSFTGNTLRRMLSKEGVTVGMLLPDGYLKYGTPALRFKLFALNNLYLLVLLVYLPLLFLLWYFKGRDEKSPVMTLYEPPEGINSAVAGVLADDRIDNRDLVSVFLRWAAMKIIRIEETEDLTSFLGRSDYIFIKLGNLPKGMSDYEHIMFSGMFPADIRHRRLSELKDSYYQTMLEARALLDNEINRMGLYEGKSRQISGIMKAMSILFAFAGVFLTAFTGDIGWFVSCAVMLFATLFIASFMPKKSAKGQNLYNRIAGFKEFIQRAEKDRLERMLERNPEYFNMTVPYAVSFGMLKGWAQKFDGLLASPPDWYVPRAGSVFSMIHFASALDTGVSAMGRTMTSQPAPQGGAGGGRSGFGGGGGFSGGGFGGGGGRGW